MQLVAYATGEHLKRMFNSFSMQKVDDNIFNLVIPFLPGKVKSFAMIEEQYRQGQDVQYIFAMILRQCRILLELRDLHDREQLSRSVGEKTITSPVCR